MLDSDPKRQQLPATESAPAGAPRGPRSADPATPPRPERPNQPRPHPSTGLLGAQHPKRPAPNPAPDRAGRFSREPEAIDPQNPTQNPGRTQVNPTPNRGLSFEEKCVSPRDKPPPNHYSSPHATLGPVKYMCESCGFIYDHPSSGDPDGGIPPNTQFEDIPENLVLSGVRRAQARLHAVRRLATARPPALQTSAEAGPPGSGHAAALTKPKASGPKGNGAPA